MIISIINFLTNIAPSGAPQDLNITSVDLTNITIQWNPVECSQRNGRIDGYRLIYYPTMNSNNNESVLIDGSNTNTYKVIGLQPRVEYTLVLGAFGGNYSLFGDESRTVVLTSVPQGIIMSISGPFYNRYNIIMQLLDFSSMVKCMAIIA